MEEKKKCVLPILAMLTAVLALAVSIAGWFRPVPGADTAELEAQIRILEDRLQALEDPADETPAREDLPPYCNLVVESWTENPEGILLTAAYLQVQLPQPDTGELTVTDCELIFSRNGEQLRRYPVTPEPGEGENSWELTVTDLLLEQAQRAEGDELSLMLEVTLSDGRVLMAPGADWYRDADGIYLVVG